MQIQGKQNANICMKFYFCSIQTVCVYLENLVNGLLERLSLSIICYKTHCIFNGVKRQERLPILNTLRNGEALCTLMQLGYSKMPAISGKELQEPPCLNCSYCGFAPY